MLSIFLYPPGLSGKLGMQTRRKKQPARPADILVHTFRCDKELCIFLSFAVIFCTDRLTSWFLFQILNLITVTTAEKSIFCSGSAKRHSVSFQTCRVRWDSNIMLRLGSEIWIVPSFPLFFSLILDLWVKFLFCDSLTTKKEVLAHLYLNWGDRAALAF